MILSIMEIMDKMRKLTYLEKWKSAIDAYKFRKEMEKNPPEPDLENPPEPPIENWRLENEKWIEEMKKRPRLDWLL